MNTKNFLSAVKQKAMKHSPVGVAKESVGLIKDQIAAKKSSQDAAILATKLKSKQESGIPFEALQKIKKYDEKTRQDKLNKMSPAERKFKSYYR